MMKLTQLMRLLCFKFTLCLVFAFSTHAKTPHLNIGWELWYPYQYYDKQSNLVGLDIEIVKLLMQEAGLSATYTELPWLRHLKYIESGDFDVAMGTSYSEDRAQYAYFSTPYRTETVHLFVKKGRVKQIPLATLADVKSSQLTIGVEEGYFYGDDYAKLINDPEFAKRIAIHFDIEENVNLLIQGKLDGFLADPATVNAFIKKYELQDQFERHPVTIYSDDIYLIFSKKSVSKSLFDTINNTLLKLKAEGKIQAIIDKWQ